MFSRKPSTLRGIPVEANSRIAVSCIVSVNERTVPYPVFTVVVTLVKLLVIFGCHIEIVMFN